MQTPQQRDHIEKVYSEMLKHLEHYNFNPVLITKENILQYIDKLADDEEERHRPDFFIGNRAEMPNKMFISVGAQVYEVLGFYVDEDDAYYYNYPCWRLSLLNTKTNVWRNMDWRLL